MAKPTNPGRLPGCIADEGERPPGAARGATAEPQPAWPVRPVVLVHGMLGQEIFYWHLLRRRLLAAGLDVLEVPLPRLALGDLREAALAFRAGLAERMAELAAPTVDVVAHSAGGLVVRYFLRRLATEPPVRRVVTLGCPHAGTRAASLLPQIGMVAQARPGSEFLRDLNEPDPTPPPVLYTAVWTPTDGVVLPASSARLPPAPNVENIEYPGITHWGYLFGPRMARTLAAELRSGFRGGERRIGRGAYADEATGTDVSAPR